MRHRTRDAQLAHERLCAVVPAAQRDAALVGQLDQVLVSLFQSGFQVSRQNLVFRHQVGQTIAGQYQPVTFLEQHALVDFGAVGQLTAAQEQAQAEIRLDSRITPEPVYVELHISPLRNRRGRFPCRAADSRSRTSHGPPDLTGLSERPKNESR